MRKKYDIFDITKYILSFMIVGMHSELFPLVVCLFGCPKDLSLHVTHAATLRTISIISYPLHVPVITVLRLLSERFFHVSHPPVIFILTCVICHFVSFLFLMLEKKKRLQFLCYAH